MAAQGLTRAEVVAARAMIPGLSNGAINKGRPWPPLVIVVSFSVGRVVGLALVGVLVGFPPGQQLAAEPLLVGLAVIGNQLV